MPVSNGYRFTNFDGTPNIPFYCDQDTGIELDIYRSSTHDDVCDVCHSHVSESIMLKNVDYPVVIQESRRMGSIYGLENDNTIMKTKRAASVAYFLLCPDCIYHCNLLMKTSDHIALGIDWWDMIDSLCETIKEIKQTKLNIKQNKYFQDAIKIGTLIYTAKSGPFYDLPREVISTYMLPDIIQVYREKAAITIQKVWKGHYQRLYQNIKETKYAKCDDCGRMRQMSDLCLEQACADWECCFKKVCKDECAYLCPHCQGTIIIDANDRSSTGEQEEYNCDWCWKDFIIHTKWWGITVTEHERRYE